MAAYKILATVDYLGIQAAFFPTKLIEKTTYFYADKYWMIETASRRWGCRSFKRIDHLPETISLQGKLIPLDALRAKGSTVYYGNQVVGRLASNGNLLGANGSVLSHNGSTVIGGNGASVIGGNGASVIGGNGASVIGGNGASILSHNGATFR